MSYTSRPPQGGFGASRRMMAYTKGRKTPGATASGLFQVHNATNKNQGKTRSIQKEKGADRRNIPYDQLPSDWREWVPEYVPGKKYTKRELTLMAELLLQDDPKPKRQHPAILTYPLYKDRLKHEIYVGSGTPDPTLVEGMYWRNHPNGRKVNSDEQRAKGSSYYR